MSCAKTESPFRVTLNGFLDSATEQVRQNVIQADNQKSKTPLNGEKSLVLPMLDYSCRRCKTCKKIKPAASFFLQKASGKIVLSKICTICRKESRQSAISAKSPSSDTCKKKFTELKGSDTPFSVLLPAGHADISKVEINELSKIKPSQIEIKDDSVKIADINTLFNIYSLGYTNLNMMYNIEQYNIYLSLLSQMNQYPMIPQFPIISQTTYNPNLQQQQLQQHQQQQPIITKQLKDNKSPTSPSSPIKGIVNSNVDFTISFAELKNLIPEDVFHGLKKEHQTQLTIYSNNPQTVFKLLPNSDTRKFTIMNELIKFYELLTVTIKCNVCKETIPKMNCFLHKDNFICRECSLKVESHELVDWNCDSIDTAKGKCFTIQCVRCKHSICYHKYLKYNRNGEIKRQNTCSYCRLKQWRDYYLGISNGSASILSNE